MKLRRDLIHIKKFIRLNIIKNFISTHDPISKVKILFKYENEIYIYIYIYIYIWKYLFNPNSNVVWAKMGWT